MTPEQSGFIAKVAPAAMESERQTGVPAPITIAQCILESGWGKTKLASLHNNFFGIKATRQDIREGHYVEYKTTEYENGQKKEESAFFDTYPSFFDCFLEHSKLLLSPNYAPAMDKKDDLPEFARLLGPRDLGGCGYSTAPDYGDKLMEIVRLYHLEAYSCVPSPLAE